MQAREMHTIAFLQGHMELFATGPVHHGSCTLQLGLAISMHPAPAQTLACPTVPTCPPHLHHLQQIKDGGGLPVAQVLKNGTEALTLQPVHHALPKWEG